MYKLCVTLTAECQSEQHSKKDCYGELWQCIGCKKWFCYADGYTNGTPEDDFCDLCWSQNKCTSGK